MKRKRGYTFSSGRWVVWLDPAGVFVAAQFFSDEAKAYFAREEAARGTGISPQDLVMKKLVVPETGKRRERRYLPHGGALPILIGMEMEKQHLVARDALERVKKEKRCSTR